MKCLVLGGTGFIGSSLVGGLQRLGHSVAVFHRGKTKVSFSDVEQIFGDRRELGLRQNLHPYPPETVQRIQKIFRWLDTDYDKIPVERAVLANTRLGGTVG